MEPEKYFSINQSQVIRGMREKCTFIRMWKFIRPIKESDLKSLVSKKDKTSLEN